MEWNSQTPSGISKHKSFQKNKSFNWYLGEFTPSWLFSVCLPNIYLKYLELEDDRRETLIILFLNDFNKT